MTGDFWFGAGFTPDGALRFYPRLGPALELACATPVAGLSAQRGAQTHNPTIKSHKNNHLKA